MYQGTVQIFAFSMSSGKITLQTSPWEYTKSRHISGADIDSKVLSTVLSSRNDELGLLSPMDIGPSSFSVDLLIFLWNPS